MTPIIQKITLIFSSYIIGCICIGYYLTKILAHKDLSHVGSHSLGATNVGRVLGKKGFVLTFLFDFAKGAFVIMVGQYLNFAEDWLLMLGIAAVVGHICPVQFRFKGGKGISTFFGMMLLYDYRIALSVVALFAPIYLMFKNFSISGLIAILPVPILFAMYRHSHRTIILSCLLVCIMMIAHKQNITAYFKKTPKEPQLL